MLAGRGFATAAVLILIALACIAAARRLERERRLIAALRARSAYDAAHAVSLDALAEAERDAVGDLRAAGVVRLDRGKYHLEPTALGRFRRKRIRLALTGAVSALLLAAGLAAFILAR